MTVSPHWLSILSKVPGYDPVATAGDCTFDEATAQRALDFFPQCLTHVKGEKALAPFVLEPWQQAIIANMFGWKRPDGTRRYREVFIYVPRKNGKSAMLGGLVCYVLFCDGERGAEIYSAAADRDQAVLVFDQAKGMILQEPELSSRAKIYATYKSVVNDAMGSTYKAISAEAHTKHGYNTHFAVIDELHAQPNRELVDVITTSTGARRQPMIVYITTADYARESICNEKLDYACKVRDRTIEDPSFLPVVYMAPKDSDWKNPATWFQANPNLGISVSEEYLRRECKRAQEVPGYLNTFLRLHLNMVTQADVAWLDMSKWDECGETFDEEMLAGRDCYCGLDLSTKLDITAASYVFPPTEDDPKWRLVVDCWLPKDNALIKEKKDGLPYDQWSKLGFIHLTPGNVIDYDYVKSSIIDRAKQFRVVQIGFDPFNATQISLQLQEEGLSLVEVRQGVKTLGEATKELEKLVMQGGLAHGGNPVLRWMASNTMVEIDRNGNIMVSKKRAKQKIDGIAATINGLSLAIVRDPSGGRSVYETRGLDFL